MRREEKRKIKLVKVKLNKNNIIKLKLMITKLVISSRKLLKLKKLVILTCSFTDLILKPHWNA